MSRISTSGLFMLFAGIIHADGISVAGSAPVVAGGSVAVHAPEVNHPTITLKDGRLLVAGGMAISGVRADRQIEADSQVWEPQTGEWQVLSSDLRFDLNQKVYLNQLADGRVLFFATRENSEIPEYQARIWNPRKNSVDTPVVSAKPKHDTDIAVLSDGRVLIIHGIEGSADTWDSRTNTTSHTEATLLENMRWHLLPLGGKQVFFLQTYYSPTERKSESANRSASLLWSMTSDEWVQLAYLPARFKEDDTLLEMGDDSVQANVAGLLYQLPGMRENWKGPIKPTQPDKLNQAENLASSSVPSAQPIEQFPAKAVQTAKPFSWDTHGALVDLLKWLAALVPISLLLMSFFKEVVDLPSSLRFTLLKTLSIAVVFLVVGSLMAGVRAYDETSFALLWGELQQWWRLEWSQYSENIIVFSYIFFLALIVVSPSVIPSVYRHIKSGEKSFFLKYAKIDGRILGITIIVLVLFSAIQEDVSNYMSNATASSGDSWWSPSDTVMWMLVAILIPIMLYFILRRFDTGKMPHLLKYAGLFFRAMAVAVSVLIIWSLLSSYAKFKMAEYAEKCMSEPVTADIKQSTLFRARQWVSCIDKRNGIIESFFFNRTKEQVMALPHVPCRFVGIWSSTRPGLKYKVTMTDDSQFIAEPVQGSNGSGEIFAGSWGVVDDKMIWLYQEGVVWPPDINPILPDSRGHFTLVEMNGTHTDFELIDAIKSNTCYL